MGAAVKLVFLDFDGVLNSHDWWRRRPTTPRRDFLNELDPAACARLQRLCDETFAQIVISSTWRLLHKRPALVEMLRARGVTARVLGVTPSLPRGPRGLEIADWLERTAPVRVGDVSGIVILDDDSDMAHLAPWHVKTHFDRGLQDWEVERAKDVLRMPAPVRASEEAAR